MNLRTLNQADFAVKRVLCRIDADVPFSTDGTITDDNRIRAAIPTLDYILKAKPQRLVLLAHRGRPRGEDQQLTLQPVADYLARHYAQAPTQRLQGQFAGGLDLFKITNQLYLAENVRFNPGEQTNDPAFVQELANQGDILAFEAFADAHRNHATTAGLLRAIPSFAGLRVIEEVHYLDHLKNQADRPFVFIIGGVKIEDKLPVIENLSKHADRFLIGGAVASTFMKAQGQDTRQSLVQDEQLDAARRILQRFGEKIVLPIDQQWQGDSIVDVGQQTIQQFEDVLADAKTIFWNGNLGKTEQPQFSKGTLMIGDYLARLSHATRVVAGGDTVGFLSAHNLAEKMTFASTGGGATLDYLAGKELPALQALQQ